MSSVRKINCTIDSIVDNGGQVYTVELVPSSRTPAFRAGQFLHLTVDDYDPAGFWPESRAFSIANSPGEHGRIRICYSVIGRYTEKMERVLKIGGKVWVKLPYGDFVIDETRDATLIAGGTGITAFIAFLDGLTPGYPRAVRLVYGARAPELLLFQDRILSQIAKVPRFEAVFFSETGNARISERFVVLAKPPASYCGPITLDSACPKLAEELNRIFYLSGPPRMVQALDSELKNRGVGADRIRCDAWA